MGGSNSCCTRDGSGTHQLVQDCAVESCRPDCPEACTMIFGEESDGFADAVVYAKGGRMVDILFRLPDGTLKSLQFSKRPLGLDFKRSAPIVLKRVAPGSHGHELGAEKGWEIHSINGVDVSEASFETVFEMLKKVTEPLPAPLLKKQQGS
eukprot:TRINITY_DN63376_c0_g1_i1.p1 TRINITY_DN63376_c0_g1~~TRINITY_DN63376_c0_g1_i1.p1  ORF type:complete len:151 (+),score=20.92 TRINITY_DN63376_c0_g1_i1:82-534(+)